MVTYRDYHTKRHKIYEDKKRAIRKSEYSLRIGRLLTKLRKVGDNEKNMSLEKRIKSHKRED